MRKAFGRRAQESMQTYSSTQSHMIWPKHNLNVGHCFTTAMIYESFADVSSLFPQKIESFLKQLQKNPEQL